MRRGPSQLTAMGLSGDVSSGSLSLYLIFIMIQSKPGTHGAYPNRYHARIVYRT